MSFIDTPDLKTGFWVGLGVALAFLVLAILQLVFYKARSKSS